MATKTINTGIKNVMNKVSMVQIPENSLLHGVVKVLDGRESFRDTDNELDEKIYTGDIFEAILGEQAQMVDCLLKIKDEKVLAQLEELAKLVKTEYVQITKI